MPSSCLHSSCYSRGEPISRFTNTKDLTVQLWGHRGSAQRIRLEDKVQLAQYGWERNVMDVAIVREGSESSVGSLDLPT